MTGNVAVREMEGILVASSFDGFTLVEDEQKVTQWVLARPSTTGLWTSEISILQFKFYVWWQYNILCSTGES